MHIFSPHRLRPSCRLESQALGPKENEQNNSIELFDLSSQYQLPSPASRIHAEVGSACAVELLCRGISLRQIFGFPTALTSPYLLFWDRYLFTNCSASLRAFSNLRSAHLNIQIAIPYRKIPVIRKPRPIMNRRSICYLSPVWPQGAGARGACNFGFVSLPA